MKPQRYKFIDVAKGILIICVFTGHLNWLAVGKGISSSYIGTIDEIARVWSSFFMAAFFFISGYCSNFNKEYRTFFLNDLRSLIVPSITLAILPIGIIWAFTGQWDLSSIRPYHLVRFISCHWFLPALFWAKQIHFFCRKIGIVSCTIVYLILGCIGVFLSHRVMDYWWMQHSFIFVIFIFFGEQFKVRRISLGNIWYLIFYIILFVLLRIILKNELVVTSGVYINCWEYPLFILIALAGTLGLMYLSKLINTNKVLERLGKSSLVIYCLHFSLIQVFFITFRSSLNALNSHTILLALLALYIFAFTGALIIERIFDTKYLRWIIGKCK